MITRIASLSLLALVLAAGASLSDRQEERVIDPGFHHLGDDPAPEWPEASEQPEGTDLELTFEGRALDREGVLFLTQRHIDDAWSLHINGVLVATLDRGSEQAEHYYVIPPGTIRDGENTLSLTCDTPTDDMTIGNIRYVEGTLRDVFDLRRVVVRVRDARDGQPLAARVTLTGPDDKPVELFYAERLHTAVRTGVLYTSDGEAALEVPAGSYKVYAVRGTEWSLGVADLDLQGEDEVVELALEREVDTTGFVACDTHVHTLTFSGHGDSSVEERLVTLAGEGVELAIATDHNHNTDYRPLQVEMGLEAAFTPVVGNEVSTPIGHLNAFPLDPADEVPPYEVHDISAAVRGCREKGAEVVVLNHPRWPDHETGPFGEIALDHHTGESKEPWAHPYDAMELINSQTEEEDPMLLFSDWFALLNRGERVVAVASSDSHTVGGVVGQGRTYVRSSTDDPAAIDVAECCRNIVDGRSTISMGIFVDLFEDGRSVVGDVLPAETELDLRVASPSWVEPEAITVFLNGVRTGEIALDDPALDYDRGRALDLVAPVYARGALPHDSWLVCVVTGKGVGGPWWPQINDYTLAATNPVYLDADGDGEWTPPRRIAERLVAERGTSPAVVDEILDGVDEAVAVQVLHLVREDYVHQAKERALKVGRDELGQRAAREASFLPDYLKALSGDR